MFQNGVYTFLHEEDGFIISSELLLLGTIAVVGLLVGLVSIRDSVLLEFDDFSRAVGLLDQSLSYAGVTDGGATTAGGLFQDSADEDEPGGLIQLDALLTDGET